MEKLNEKLPGQEWDCANCVNAYPDTDGHVDGDCDRCENGSCYAALEVYAGRAADEQEKACHGSKAQGTEVRS